MVLEGYEKGLIIPAPLLKDNTNDLHFPLRQDCAYA